ncbi:MAG: hypothetical protein O6947_05330, partial [Acidobacteria bacterium]|nr:hypothetical protein [Acidobacteriota bacterium]
MKERSSAFWSKGGILLLVLGIALLPSLTNWAIQRERNLAPGGDGDGSPIERPSAGVNNYNFFARPEGISPLAGVSFDSDVRKLKGKDTLFTSTGVFRVSDPDNQKGLPADLREPATSPSRGAGLKPGAFNYAILSEEGKRHPADVERRIAENGGRVAGLIRGGYMLWVSPELMSELQKSNDFRAFSPVPRAHKIFSDVGLRPLLEKKRAASPILQLRVEVLGGLKDPSQVERRLAARSESVRLVGSHYGRDIYAVEADAAQTRRIAGLEEVLRISENHEHLLQ